MKSDLPAHEVARLAALGRCGVGCCFGITEFVLDYRFNGQRCLAEDGEFAGPRVVLDVERTACKGCMVKFDFIVRRHHCRYLCVGTLKCPLNNC